MQYIWTRTEQADDTKTLALGRPQTLEPVAIAGMLDRGGGERVERRLVGGGEVGSELRICDCSDCCRPVYELGP